MSIILILSTIIAVSCIIILIEGIITDDERFIVSGAIGLSLTIFIGFGICGCGGLIPVTTQTEIFKVDPNTISRSKTSLTVKVDGTILNSEIVEHYQAPDHLLRVKKVCLYNSYNGLINAPTYSIFVEKTDKP